MHTIAVVAALYSDPLFINATSEEKNALKWAGLLHDITKLSTPTIETKDHIHPFKSSAMVLELFERLGFIADLTDEKRGQLFQVRRLITESVKPLPEKVLNSYRHGTPACSLMQSHHNLAEIFYYLWK